MQLQQSTQNVKRATPHIPILTFLNPGVGCIGAGQSDYPGNIPDQTEESGPARAAGEVDRNRATYLQDQQENAFKPSSPQGNIGCHLHQITIF